MALHKLSTFRVFSQSFRSVYYISSIRSLNTNSLFNSTHHHNNNNNYNGLFFNQTRNSRLNPGRFKMKKALSNPTTAGAVVEPTPPKLFKVRSLFDTKRWFLHIYWNLRSWWEALDPRISLKKMKTEAINLYTKYRKYEAKGDITDISPILNLRFYREAKKKIDSQNRKNLSITWDSTEPSASILSLRYLKYPGVEAKIFQVGVQMKSKQGLTIKKKGKIVKKVPMTKVTEILVMEASLAIGRHETIQWRILDILNEEGIGILPRDQTQAYFEEQ